MPTFIQAHRLKDIFLDVSGAVECRRSIGDSTGEL